MILNMALLGSRHGAGALFLNCIVADRHVVGDGFYAIVTGKLNELLLGADFLLVFTALAARIAAVRAEDPRFDVVGQVGG